MAKGPTHTQYEELRRYEDGGAHYTFSAPPSSLTLNGWLERVPGSGESKRTSAWRITRAGRAQLAVYRERWKVSA